MKTLKLLLCKRTPLLYTLSIGVILFNCLLLNAQDGYCMVNGTTTGGSGGSSVTVSNASDFKSYAQSSSKYIINVSGTIDLGGSVQMSNKTIQGINTSSKIIGNLDCKENVIVQNLTITSPYGDGVTLWTANHCFINHVTFYDCTDGCCDITQGSDYITVSYCKFYYTHTGDHRFTMILGNTDDGDYHVTIHHNWWAENCDQRMPSGSYSTAHIYNNYFTCSGNSYCTNARIGTNWLVQNNYYDGAKDPCYYENGGRMQISGNIYNNCSGTISSSTSISGGPSYSYNLISTSSVPSTVSASAGNTSSGGGTNPTFNGTYNIIASHSGKALDVYAWGTSNGTNICQWSYWGGATQQFNIASVDGEWHRITPVLATDKAIDVDGISTADGANIFIWSYWGGYGQQFRFQSAGTGVWRIIARHSEKCVDVAGVSISDGANVQQWHCSSGAQNQMFRLNRVSSNTDLTKSATDNIQIYPNPVTNSNFMLAVSGISEANIKLKIVDMQGRTVYSGIYNNGPQINIQTDLDAGTYILQVVADNKSFVKKLNVE